MRVTLAFLAGALPFFLFACADDQAPGEESDADTDSDSDTDSDTDSDSDTDAGDAGDDIATADTIAYGKDFDTPAASDAIGAAGDRDVFALDMVSGETVMAYTAAYAVDAEVGDPDTVLRVLDASGAVLVENDDMPTRLQETDSAVYFQAPDTETYYFEVMEWSDWDPTSDGPEGGADWDYDLYAIPFAPGDTEPNDSMGEVDDLWDAKKSTLWNNFFGADYPTDFFGVLGSGSDVDMYRIDLGEADFLTVILYPSYAPNADLQLSMYDEAGELVAQTDTPEFDPNRDVAFEDVALLHWAQPGSYYFSVEDLNGTTGTTYGGMIVLYLESNSEFETENNDVVVAGNPVSFEESTNFPGYFFGTMTGAVGSAGDDRDCYSVSASEVGGDLDGMYVAARTQAMQVGTLVDTAVTVYEDDGSTVIATAGTSDLHGTPDGGVTDIEIPDGQSEIHICVEAEAADSYAGADQYLLAMELSPEPVFD